MARVSPESYVSLIIPGHNDSNCPLGCTHNNNSAIYQPVRPKQMPIVDIKGNKSPGKSKASDHAESLYLVSEVGEDGDMRQIRRMFFDYSNENKINLDDFQDIMGFKRQCFAKRLFDRYTSDPDGEFLSVTDFLKCIRALLYGSAEEKIRSLFSVYDASAKGFLDQSDIRRLLLESVQDTPIVISEKLIDILTRHIFEKMNIKRDGKITVDEFWNECNRYPGLFDAVKLTSDQLFHVNKFEKSRQTGSGPRRRARNRSSKTGVSGASWIVTMMDNTMGVCWTILYILLNIVCFALGFLGSGEPLAIMARSSGYMLAVNLSICVVVILGHIYEFSKFSWLYSLMIVDYSTPIHRATGGFALILAIVHSTFKIANIDTQRMSSDDEPPAYWEYFFTPKEDTGWLIPGTAYPTGLGLLLGLVILAAFSGDYGRKRGNFWAFYATHYMYVPIFILGIFHSAVLFAISVPPFLMYVVGKILPFWHGKRGPYTFVINKATILPSRVLQLHVNRPDNFDFVAGDYAYVCIPKISFFEWHMFSFSSPPHKKGELWFHVKCVGPWTTALYDFVEKQDKIQCYLPLNFLPKAHGGDGESTSIGDQILREFQKRLCDHQMEIPIYIDGPYQSIGLRSLFDVNHAIIIASDIGVTSVASILQCVQQAFTHPEDHSFKLKKVDFVWTNTSQDAFEWFLHLLCNLGQSGQYMFRLHIYLTSGYELFDLQGFVLHVALHSMYLSGQRDVITGLNTLLKPGLPNWELLFAEILAKQQVKTSVFYAGTLASIDVVRKICVKRKLTFLNV